MNSNPPIATDEGEDPAQSNDLEAPLFKGFTLSFSSMKPVSEFLCPNDRQGEICLGGINSKCGINHYAPMKVCSLIAIGIECLGGEDSKCGFNHDGRKWGSIECINGFRDGQACDWTDCPYRHPEDKVTIKDGKVTVTKEEKIVPPKAN